MRAVTSANGRWTKIPLFLLGFWTLIGPGMALVPGGSPRAAETGKSRYEILKQRAEVEAAREKTWRERYAKMVQAVQDARKRLEEIEASRTRHNRGVTRQQEEQALAVLQQAQKAMDDFFEEARREEVPPGWLR